MQIRESEFLDIHKKLDIKFYLRPVLEVAPDLLGKLFIKKEKDKILAAMITEVEAYDGTKDQAAHSFTGITERNKHMFFEGGITYVYFTYGVHYCLNIVTGKEGDASAVLIRSMEPIIGINTFARRRFNKVNINDKEFKNLLNGPGKICQAFNISKKDSGKSLLLGNFNILDYKKIKKELIQTSPRIGITKSTDLLWRFYISNSKFLSR